MRVNHDNGATRVGRVIGGVVGGAIGAAVGGVGKVGRAVLRPLHLSRRMRTDAAADYRVPGAPPGIESVPDLNTPPPPGAVLIRCIDYGKDRIESSEITDLSAFLAAARPEWAAVRWINIDGLHPYVVHKFMQAYGLHTLAAEDVFHPHQRPKLEQF